MIVEIQDDLKRKLLFGTAPKRVVSLVPSDTYSVAALGCGGALVGRTDYCELPAEVVAGIPSVGGTKNPDVDAICALEPDLVIANQEENTKKDLEELAQRGIKVLVCFPKRAADGIAHLARLARVFRVDQEPEVRALLKQGYEGIREAERARARLEPIPTFCPIWMDPLMTINGDTFISSMLDLAGASNVFVDRERRYPLAADLGLREVPLNGDRTRGRDVRYPRITKEELVTRAPSLVLLPDEPHPFSEEDAEVFRALPIPAAERRAIVRTGGKDLCWYGAWTIEGLTRLRALVDGFR
ncbi:MAG: Vitamin transporter, B12-binding component BtuF [Labilithrix sp.]|nr:Vitamin transporter, B12-binding component BtuF [Labilithrix sp.]